jgi:putative ABC transport system permease protein
VIVPVEYVWSAHVMGTGHAPGDDRIGPPWQAELMPGLPAIVMKPKGIADAYGLRARYRDAETMAFFPAETLTGLYDVMGQAAQVMLALTLAAQILVIAAILAGILAVLGLQRRSFAVLRALGAPAGYVFLSVWLYVAIMVMGGAAVGLPLGWAAAHLVSAMVAQRTGIAIVPMLGAPELMLAGLMVFCGLVLALLPAWLCYRRPVVEALR